MWPILKISTAKVAKKNLKRTFALLACFAMKISPKISSFVVP